MSQRPRVVRPLCFGVFVVDRHSRAVMLGFLQNWEEAIATERIQRRLAAILAADVVGYSRLMAADEAGTRGGSSGKIFARAFVTS